jgi:predicted Zn-dependent peptidase
MPISFRHAVLPNGLTIIGEVDPDAHTAAAGFFVRTGSRDETPDVMGVSHFLEHMMFKGTQDLTSDDINRAFDELGARNNAYTSSEVTCFHAAALPERAGETVDLLGRMMRPALRAEDFATEKSVILEEIAMYEDNPFSVLYEQTMEKHYGKHPLGHRVIGTKETVSALTPERMRAYFEGRYSADNTVLSVAGRVDFDPLVERAATRCSAWASTRPGRDATPPPTPGGSFEVKDPKVNRAYLLALAPAPSVGDDRRYAAAMLAQILGATDNSRLHWALVETGIAEDAQAGVDAHDGAGEYFVYASGDPAAMGRIWDTLRTEMDGLIASVTEEDLERLRNKIATAATLAGERPAGRMDRLGRVWSSLRCYRPLDEELERIKRVTLDELREVHEAFPIRPHTVGRLSGASA